MRTRLVATVLLSTISLLTTSCALATGVKECRFESRSVDAAGRVVLTDAAIVFAHVALIEERESSLRPTAARLIVSAQSDLLYGHMTRAELSDSRTPSTLLGSYLPGVGQETWAPNLVGTFGPYDWPMTIDEARAVVESGTLVLDITTDLPGQPLVRVPLTSTSHADGSWFRERGDACG